VSGAYAAAGRAAAVHAFLNDMEAQFARADLVVCRSGATTCAELTAAGKAAILIPFAQAADDHQRINARALTTGGAARMIEEQDLTGEALGRTITALLEASGSSSNPSPDAGPSLRAMEQASRALGRPDAAARVADLLLEPARA
jgi:UDP-N-acetylglucosamine--N-acetylmuramyl-(pentapeptide) pyrophosphoryl-undecaprenol N-acetylglucosamine transferase